MPLAAKHATGSNVTYANHSRLRTEEHTSDSGFAASHPFDFVVFTMWVCVSWSISVPMSSLCVSCFSIGFNQSSPCRLLWSLPEPIHPPLDFTIVACLTIYYGEPWLQSDAGLEVGERRPHCTTLAKIIL